MPWQLTNSVIPESAFFKCRYAAMFPSPLDSVLGAFLLNFRLLQVPMFLSHCQQISIECWWIIDNFIPLAFLFSLSARLLFWPLSTTVSSIKEGLCMLMPSLPHHTAVARRSTREERQFLFLHLCEYLKLPNCWEVIFSLRAKLTNALHCVSFGIHSCCS